jgi:hypothetical protein
LATEPAEWAGGDPITGEAQEEDGRGFRVGRIKRRFLTKRHGQQLTLYAGLVDALHTLSAGAFEVTTAIARLPSEANGMTAVVTARAAIFDGTNRDLRLRLATGIGDASPQIVDPRLAPHLVRAAETRAKARALRDLLNVAAVWVGELGPGDLPTGDDAIQVDGQLYRRRVSWDAYQRRVADGPGAGAAPDARGVGAPAHRPAAGARRDHPRAEAPDGPARRRGPAGA